MELVPGQLVCVDGSHMVYELVIAFVAGIGVIYWFVSNSTGVAGSNDADGGDTQ